ncbi:fasciclin domain-containing protein [Kitasatospora sp. NPDC050543]|uniref:fasciclin domain-containing protein n=1 Tax=Kitasatospora sp. NPDC050543 TaxID=3364054 RepID=UPI0037AC72E2
MTTSARVRAVAALLAAGALSLSLTACGGDDDGGYSNSAAQGGGSGGAAAAPAAPANAANAAGAANPAGAAGAANPAGAAGQPFGAACAAVPPNGAGSFSGMAQDPVATAASNNPLLSTLVTAVKAAGLVDTLNSAKDITVYAPTNEAFAKIPKATLDAVLADKAKLTAILTYHVSPGGTAPTALPGMHKTLQGGQLTVAGSGQNFTVNGNSKVLCGNVKTANATVYIVDTVLMPPAS